jgi:hypothetical protein
MFNVRPNLPLPDFNVREPEEEVPGFRVNADGTIGKAPMIAAKLDGNPFDIFEPQPLAAWPPPYLASDPDPLVDQVSPRRGQPQMSGDVIPICTLLGRSPEVCVYRCENGANVATPNRGYCPSIIRQPLWLGSRSETVPSF